VVSGRRVATTTPHNPAAARDWGWAAAVLFGLAALAVGRAAGLVVAEWIETGSWAATSPVAGWLIAAWALAVSGCIAWALRLHAIDGPPDLIAAAVEDRAALNEDGVW
jgi:hypothetical protein